MFAGFHRQPLVPQRLHDLHFLPQFFHGQPVPQLILVGELVAAVGAVVDAVAGEVQRRKQHDALAVDRLFDFGGSGEHFVQEGWILHLQQDGGFLRGQALVQGGLGDNPAHRFRIGGNPLPFVQGAGNTGIIYEGIGSSLFFVYHGHFSLYVKDVVILLCFTASWWSERI